MSANTKRRCFTSDSTTVTLRKIHFQIAILSDVSNSCVSCFRSASQIGRQNSEGARHRSDLIAINISGIGIIFLDGPADGRTNGRTRADDATDDDHITVREIATPTRKSRAEIENITRSPQIVC